MNSILLNMVVVPYSKYILDTAKCTLTNINYLFLLFSISSVSALLLNTYYCWVQKYLFHHFDITSISSYIFFFCLFFLVYLCNVPARCLFILLFTNDYSTRFYRFVSDFYFPDSKFLAFAMSIGYILIEDTRGLTALPVDVFVFSSFRVFIYVPCVTYFMFFSTPFLNKLLYNSNLLENSKDNFFSMKEQVGKVVKDVAKIIIPPLEQALSTNAQAASRIANPEASGSGAKALVTLAMGIGGTAVAAEKYGSDKKEKSLATFNDDRQSIQNISQTPGFIKSRTSLEEVDDILKNAHDVQKNLQDTPGVAIGVETLARSIPSYLNLVGPDHPAIPSQQEFGRQVNLIKFYKVTKK